MTCQEWYLGVTCQGWPVKSDIKVTSQVKSDKEIKWQKVVFVCTFVCPDCASPLLMFVCTFVCQNCASPLIIQLFDYLII